MRKKKKVDLDRERKGEGVDRVGGEAQGDREGGRRDAR